MPRLSLTEAQDRWYSEAEIPGFRYRLNDTVAVAAGVHESEEAAVISLEALDPEPTYLVELLSGAGDLTLPESMLRPSS
jgi:hypothetical protein